MLMALVSAFALSQAFRTIASVMAAPLQAQFNVGPQALGLFAGSFHFAFGAMQLFMGIGIDLHGVRRTVLLAFPLAIAGSAVSALSSSFAMLVFGQVLIGIGCAPAFLVCTVFIARYFAPARFAAVSGMTMGLGGIGMLVTGTPLAWLIQSTSWRMGFAALGILAVLAWFSIWYWVREQLPEPGRAETHETVGQAIAKFGSLFLMPHTLGIVLLAGVGYASFIALRGLWLGPMLMQRYGFSLIETGNVALVMSLTSLLGPPLFGKLDPGPQRRRRWIVGFALVVAALFGLMAFTHRALLDVAVPIVIGLLSGFLILQYADVRSSYPAAITGRAMAVLTMAMFLGVAVMQWLTGWVASIAIANGIEPFAAVLASIAGLLVAGALAFMVLPGPPEAQAVP